MIADIVVIAIMALCIFLGYWRGLIHVAVRILGFVVALIVALILYTPVSNYIIENTNAVESIQTVVQDKIYKEDKKDEQYEESEENGTLTESIGRYIENYTEEIKTNSVEHISKGIAVIVVKVATWIGLFIAVRILMIFIKIFARVIEKIPIIKQFNKARGNYIWYIRRIFNNIFSTCSYKSNSPYNSRKPSNKAD